MEARTRHDRTPSRRGRAILVAHILLVSTLTVALFAFVPPRASAYVPRAPILIDEDANFTVANGVTGGNGTAVDPYLIEGWEINASLAHGIEVRNTRAYFVVRGVYVHDGNTTALFGFSGVYLYNVSHSSIEDFVSFNNLIGVQADTVDDLFVQGGAYTFGLAGGLVFTGVTNATVDGANLQNNGLAAGYLSGSSWVTLVNLTMVNNVAGLSIDGSNNITVRTSDLAGSTVDPGVRVSGSQDITIHDSDVHGNTFGGVVLTSSTRVTLLRNRIYSNSGGGGALLIQSSTAILLARNDITLNGAGVDVASTQGLTAFGNRIYNAMRDVRLTGSTNALIFHNTFGDAIWDPLPTASDDRGPENAWDNGYPGGGNRWINYAGLDTCSGPAQDVCPDSDGLGDVPRVIDANSQDRYPLMAPCAPDCPPTMPTMLPARLAGAGLADVLLSWQLSPDDGGGEDDVAGYEILVGTVYDPSGLGYALLAGVPSSTADYTHLGGGLGIVQGAYYQVRAVEQGTGRSVSAREQAATYVKGVPAGWNLLTIPLEQADWSVPAVLQTIAYTGLRTYVVSDADDPWKARHPGRPGDLGALVLGAALWVESSGGPFVVAGLVKRAPTVTLLPGWNLVGYAAATGAARDVTLAGVAGVTRVESSEAGVDPYGLREVLGADLLQIGEAYWVLVTGAGGIWVQG